mmetsp:Transcript_12056/g.21608  ORF Transcript_12056/g.21608 Transcript_12056/m.21608 type:complete len:239 (-) Transcript_12056:270-986(-)
MVMSKIKSLDELSTHRGVVSQIQYLNQKDYWTWLDQPVIGAPLFFANPLLESITKTPWWMVPLIWVPIFSAVMVHAVRQLGLPLVVVPAFLLYGIVAWQFLEYTIHRFVFHIHCVSPLGMTLQFLFHGCHHKFPCDGLRLVFPPLPASLLVLLVRWILNQIFAPAPATALFAGMGFGYVIYDVVHYHLHHSPDFCDRVWILKDLRRRHLRHHYDDSEKGFGISSVGIDVVFGTYDWSF